MGLFRRSDIWWYEFWFAGRRIQESSKSPSKTIARTAEQNRRRELEQGFNNFTDVRHERIRTFSEVADEFFNGYKLRLPDSAVFADYAIDHLKRLVGTKMLVDFNEAAVIKYQAYSDEEKERMLQEARKARSPHIYFGEGRTIPLNSALLPALTEYVAWYTDRFHKIRPEWCVFPFGKPRPSDPTRPVTTLKTAWSNVRENANVTGRWHDNRHTLITELAESGAGDQTIMDIAGHVSKQMLKHYSHIRMEAKRTALESIVRKNGNAAGATPAATDDSPVPGDTQHFEGESLQKSLQCNEFGGHRRVVRARKSMKRLAPQVGLEPTTLRLTAG